MEENTGVRSAEKTTGIIVQEGFDAIAVKADVSDDAQMAAATARALSHFGKIDILHNNTGITLFGGPIDVDLDAWDRAMAVNVKSVVLACRHVLPHMLERGAGAIVNISWISAVRVGAYEMPSYYASKAAMNHLTHAIALQYADKGIRCNAVLPGLINTPMVRGDSGMNVHHGGLDQQLAERDAMSPTGKDGRRMGRGLRLGLPGERGGEVYQGRDAAGRRGPVLPDPLTPHRGPAGARPRT